MTIKIDNPQIEKFIFKDIEDVATYAKKPR